MIGDTYTERSQHQLQEWVRGNPIHNEQDNECCPDFSCCIPELLQVEDERKRFAIAVANADESIQIGMLATYLGYALSYKGIECVGRNV